MLFADLLSLHLVTFFILVITSNGALKSATDTLAKQGQKSLFCWLIKAPKLQFPNPIVLSHLFDLLVRPVLENGCETRAT